MVSLHGVAANHATVPPHCNAVYESRVSMRYIAVIAFYSLSGAVMFTTFLKLLFLIGIPGLISPVHVLAVQVAYA